MITSELDIFKLALDTVGSRSDIAATSENSREAKMCLRWYDSVRDLVFRAAFWSSTEKVARLEDLAERTEDLWSDTQPNPGWMFAHSLPADFVAARYLDGYSRFDLGWLGSEIALHSNIESPILNYSFRNTDPETWDVSLQMAVVSGLAAFICLPLTGKTSRAKLLMDHANDSILKARATAANEDEQIPETLPEWISARGYSGTYGTGRYIYPYGPLLALPVVNV